MTPGHISLACHYRDLEAVTQRMKYAESCSQTIVIRSADTLDLSEAKLNLGNQDFKNPETANIACDCYKTNACFSKSKLSCFLSQTEMSLEMSLFALTREVTKTKIIPSYIHK